MNTSIVNPTAQINREIQVIADEFNLKLFEGKLPQVMFTMQRSANSLGHFIPAKWEDRNGNEVGEISLNPAYFSSQPLIQIFQTIVHEQCHLWQHAYGKPSRHGYHNQEWAKKMIEIGLVPSSTGVDGGKQTGQKMSDYPAQNGIFIEVCRYLVKKGLGLSWVDIQTTKSDKWHKSVMLSNKKQDKFLFENNIRQLVQADLTFNTHQNKKRKTRYLCRQCQISIWGKAKLNILCGICNKSFEETIS